LNARMLLSATGPLPRVPVEPAPPICNVPELRKVPPAYVLVLSP
jgi:hypothetical protein